MAKIVIEIEYDLKVSDYPADVRRSDDPEQAAVDFDRDQYEEGVVSISDLTTWSTSVNVEFFK